MSKANILKTWTTNMLKALLNHGVFAVKEIKSTGNAQVVAEHWEQDVKALWSMNELKEEHILRFITAFRRRKRDGGEEHYLMFEWADGGNLRSLWRAMPILKLTATLVRDVVKQLHGLAKALEAAHNLNKMGASYTHGDLKPENLLLFKHGGGIGTVKIGDWGEAKRRGQVTGMRFNKTTTRYSTSRYEAPELKTGVQAQLLGQSIKRRSRLNDIWSMGCIILEFMIWLLYGMEGLDRFNRELGNEGFYQLNTVQGKKAARVHDEAVRWMDHMAQDPRCKTHLTALGDLLELVRTALLVVELPRQLGTNVAETAVGPRVGQDPEISIVEAHRLDDMATTSELSPHSNVPSIDIPSFSFSMADSKLERLPLQPRPEPAGRARCLASEFRARLGEMFLEDEQVGYWYTSETKEPPQAKSLESTRISPAFQTKHFSSEFRGPTRRDFHEGIQKIIAARTHEKVSLLFLTNNRPPTVSRH